MILLLALLIQDPPLQVPEGFVLERVAGPPLVERPIMACFDDRGRLYVSDSAGVNLKGGELIKDPPHRIRLLEDTDGDGKVDKSSVWADKLVFPQGLLWHQGAIYCTSPPSFWKLEDTDGDGVCDRRTELLTGLANTGVADDAHGACLGPDGRIYFLPGRMSHNIKSADGRFAKKATGPWLMRCRADGTDMEIVCGTQGNPVEVDWLPEGDFFVSGTFWAPDSFGGGLRDALIHGVEGGEYAVRDRIYSDRKRTGDFLPVLIPMIATAPSGLMTIKSSALGAGYSGNVVCTYFNTHRVQRHILERDGATFKAKTEDLVLTAHPDFHPTDVLEDADGSLLVVDTGGWFRIGCPTSQIAKPQVLGAIYRLRKKDMPKVDDGRGLRVSWNKPADLFDDARFVVREKAVQEAARRPARELVDTMKSPSSRVRLNVVWALSRIGDAESQAHLGTMLKDPDAGVRQAAVTACGLLRNRSALSRLASQVESDTPPIRREAAAALGRIGSKAASTSLLQSIRLGGDRYLEHAVLFALIRIGDRDGMIAALHDPSAAVRRAALIALDQMEGGNLTPDLVTPMLDPIDPALQQAALKVIMSRPGWSNEIYGLVKSWLGEKSLDEERQDLLNGVLVAFSRDAAMQDLMARTLREETASDGTRLLVLEAMARSLTERVPSTWLAEARWALDAKDERVIRQAVAVIRSAACADFDEAILRLAREDSRSAELRIETVAAVAPRLAKLEGPVFRFLLVSMDKDKAPLLRLSAAEAVGKSPLDDAQLHQLVAHLGSAGPLEMPRLISVFERSKSATLGKKLVPAIEKAPGFQSLTSETLRRVLQGYPDEVRALAGPVAKKLEVDTTQMKERLDSMAGVLEKGDARAGREIFFGKKAGCTACHTIAGQGGKVGPDLSKIGSIRVGRDLLEAIVFPSATFARGFEPFLIRTKDGGVHDGLIARETPDAVFLFTAERVEKRIPRASVELIQQSKLSVMPQGLDNQLSRDELRDLITYLASLK